MVYVDSRPPFYILQRFKLQLDENVTRKNLAEKRETSECKRSKARSRWRIIQSFIRREMVDPLTKEEKVLWERENTVYYNRVLANLEESRTFGEKRHLYSSIRHEDHISPKDAALAKLYSSFWFRKNRVMTFHSLVARAHHEATGCHAKRTNRALGACTTCTRPCSIPHPAILSLHSNLHGHCVLQ